MPNEIQYFTKSFLHTAYKNDEINNELYCVSFRLSFGTLLRYQTQTKRVVMWL